MRSNFFFINRIFKNDLIADCLCALNHVVGPVHKSEEGRRRGKARPPGRGHPPPAPPGLREDDGGWGGEGEGDRPPSATPATGTRRREECCRFTGTPRAAESPFRS